MKRGFISTIPALFLSLAVALVGSPPSSAWALRPGSRPALRPANVRDSAGLEEEISRALRADPAGSVSARLSAGLEEPSESLEWTGSDARGTAGGLEEPEGRPEDPEKIARRFAWLPIRLLSDLLIYEQMQLAGHGPDRLQDQADRIEALFGQAERDRAALEPRVAKPLELRELSDHIGFLRMRWLMVREVSPGWRSGEQMSNQAKQDLWDALGLGNRLLRQEPPPQQQTLLVQIRLAQAQAVQMLMIAGEFDRQRAHETITALPIPLKDSLGFLHAMELAETRRLRTRVDALRAEDDDRQALQAQAMRHWEAALAYAFFRAAHLEEGRSLPAEYEDGARDLALMLAENPMEFGREWAGLAAERVRMNLNLFLWDVRAGKPGPVPAEMIEEVLAQSPATLLEGAILAARLLVSSALSAERAAYFTAISRHLEERLRKG